MSLDTLISMNCTDPDPHPVDNERICFNVERNGEDWTESYCEDYKGNYNESGDEYCCLDKTIENFRFLESCEHNLKFYCEDALGNKGPIDDEKFKVDGESFTIKINQKWNLWSVPFVLINPDIEKVIPNSMNDTIIATWAYDAETDEWYVHTPDGVENDNLHELHPGWGYWTIAKSDTELTIGGGLLNPLGVPPSRNLVEGWNLIGYWGTDGLDAYNGPWSLTDPGAEVDFALGSLCGVFWYKEYSTPLWAYWEPYLDSNKWVKLNGDDYFVPGQGAWVFMRSDGKYTQSDSACSFLP